MESTLKRTLTSDNDYEEDDDDEEDYEGDEEEEASSEYEHSDEELYIEDGAELNDSYQFHGKMMYPLVLTIKIDQRIYQTSTYVYNLHYYVLFSVSFIC